MTHEEKIPIAVQKVFPSATIQSVSKFLNGLTSSVYKVEISEPNKILAIKFFPKKIEERVEKSSQVSNYLRENNLPSPYIYYIEKDEEGWVIMDCLPGRVASEVWETASFESKQTLLTHAGALLRKIHDLKVPPFWTHHKHEVVNQKEWIEWTKLRIQKYLAFAEEKIDRELFEFLKIRFARLQDLYDTHPNFRFTPLHWDYHLSNINIDEEGEISGVFDFDNTMKGHDMADIGQAVYWLSIQQKISEVEIVESLLSGYGNLSVVDREFVELHSLLFLVGVMRSTWSKAHLKWLNDLHLEVLRRCLRQ